MSQAVLNLTALFKEIDCYPSFVADGTGDAAGYINSGANPWPNLIPTLDHVSPARIATQD